MKFKVYRGLEYVYCCWEQVIAPCEVAKFVIDKPLWWDEKYPETVGQEKWWVDDKEERIDEAAEFVHWEIELDSLEDLLQFAFENGRLIVSKGIFPSIILIDSQDGGG